MTAETVSGRMIPRYRGPAIEHHFCWHPAHDPSYRDGGLRGICDCGEARTVDGDHPDADLVRARAPARRPRGPLTGFWPPPRER